MKNSPETLAKRNALKREWKRKIDPASFPHFIRRRCKDCGRIKPCQWMNAFTQTGVPEYRARCVECQKMYWHKMRTTDRFRESRNRRRKKVQIENKKKMVAYLGGKCMICGYDKNLAALTFHHRDPTEKEFAVAAIQDHNWSKVKRELDKCDLLCFNCHMELHGGG